MGLDGSAGSSAPWRVDSQTPGGTRLDPMSDAHDGAEGRRQRLEAAYAGVADGNPGPWITLCDPAIEIIEPKEIPDASTFRGHSGALALLEKLGEVFPGMKFLPTSILENDDVVLVEVTWIGRGAASSAPMELKLFHVWRFIGDKAMTIHAFVDEKSASENAGFLA